MTHTPSPPPEEREPKTSSTNSALEKLVKYLRLEGDRGYANPAGGGGGRPPAPPACRGGGGRPPPASLPAARPGIPSRDAAGPLEPAAGRIPGSISPRLSRSHARAGGQPSDRAFRTARRRA